MPLRDYQQSAVECTINWLKYKDTPAIVDIATGGGKSHIIAALAEHYAGQGKRVCILADRMELLEQTGEKITHPINYYSASVGEKKTDAQIIVAGIQSIADAPDLPEFDIILCDECDLIPNNEEMGRWWTFINRFPNAKLAGFTATPYRLKGGELSWGEVIYEMKYPALLEAGHLAPLSNKLITAATPKLEDVKVVMGEYVQSQLEHVMEDPALVEAACKAILAYSHDRHSVLIFCVSVNHGRLIAQTLEASGAQCVFVDGKTNKAERKNAVEQFKTEFGSIRYLINCELFLVGFDAPNVDMIVCLRPTKSKRLHEQMLGRGVRKAEGKTNCLIVDMAGNLQEHGALGTPYREKARNEAPAKHGKICPECESFCKPLARECPDCAYPFPEPESPKVSHGYEADQSSKPVYTGSIEHHKVWDVKYKKHISKKGNETLMVSYQCDYGKYGNISEWLTRGWRMDKFFKERGHELGMTSDTYTWDDLIFKAENFLKKPTMIVVDHSDKFPRVIRVEYAEEIKPTIKEALEGDWIPF